MPANTTEIGMALLIILLLVKDVIIPTFRGGKDDPLKKTNETLDRVAANLSTISDTLGANKAKIHDMHEWLKPDHTGQQSWKSHPACSENRQSIGRLFSYINDRFAELREAISGK